MSEETELAESMTELQPSAAPKRSQKAANLATERTAETMPSAAPKRIRKAPSRQPSARPAASRNFQPTPFAYIVHYLPNYAEDGRSDPRAGSVYCGEIGGGTSSLFDEIEARFVPEFGGGYFRVVARDTDGKIKNSQVLRVQEPAGEEFTAGDEEPGDSYEMPDTFKLQLEVVKLREQLRAQAGQRSAGGISELVEAMEAVDRLRGQSQQQPSKSLIEQIREAKELLREINPLTAPRSNPEPPDPQAALLNFVLSDPDATKQAASKLRGLFAEDAEIFQPEPEPSWTDKLLGFVTSPVVASVIAPFIPSILQKIGLQPAGASLDTQAAQSAAPQPAAAIVQPPALPQVDEVQRDLQQLFGLTLNTMAHGGDPEIVAQGIDAFQERHPIHRGIVQAFIDGEPGELVKRLAEAAPQAAQMLGQPGAIEWLGRLQQCFNDESEQGATEQAQTASQR